MINKKDIDDVRMKATGWISAKDLSCPKGPVLVVSTWTGEINSGDGTYGIYLVNGDLDDCCGDPAIVGGDVYASYASDVLYWRPAPTIITK